MVRFRFLLVGRGGFEPPKSKTSDLQSDPFGRSGICPYLVGCSLAVGAGDWTRTHNLLITNQLLCQLSYTGNFLPFFANHYRWCLGAESNHRQADFQSAALPTELPRHLWRPKTGSNRRPPAWQAGALTNWAIGPQRIRTHTVPVYNTLFEDICQAFFQVFKEFFEFFLTFFSIAFFWSQYT